MSLSQLGKAIASDYEEALAFKAPYLIEKVLEECLAATEEEAEALFLEVKRYLVMSHACVPRWGIPSYACRLDEVWHNFVLFTREYEAYCHRHFGRFMHHAPSNAPKRSEPEPDAAPPLEPDAPKTFAEHYKSFYGIELPDAWHDELHVTTSRRAIGRTDGLSGLSLHAEGDDVRLVAPNGKDVFVGNRRVLPALQLILTCRPFFVRELPGELRDEEKVGLVSTLVARRRVRLY